MELKERIRHFINNILIDYDIKQQDLADMLGIGLGSLAGYLAGKETPRVEVLIKLSEIGGIPVDDILKKDDAETKGPITIQAKDNATVIAPIAGRDVYYNAPPKKIYHKYSYQPGDLTEAQAAKILELVNEIVDLEKTVKKNAKTHAAILGSLKKYFKVAYYRKIGEENFDKAITYLQQWRGRLQKSKKFPKLDEDTFRKDRYKQIHTIARNELKWTKDNLDDYIYDRFNVASIKELSNKDLEQLYNVIHGLKRKNKKT